MGIPKPLVQINQTFIVVSVLLGLFFSKVILVLPLVVGVVTLVKKQNPIIKAGRKFLKKPLSHYVMEEPAQQMFNQWIATICMGIALFAFLAGWNAFGYTFSILIILAAGIALMGFCIGCTIRYRYIMWKHKRVTSKSV